MDKKKPANLFRLRAYELLRISLDLLIAKPVHPFIPMVDGPAVLLLGCGDLGIDKFFLLIGERINLPYFMGNDTAHENFNPFDPVQHELAQLFIKQIQVYYIVKVDVVLKSVIPDKKTGF
nr:hypothetical protein [Candidatus Electrothrix aestuarii]